MHIDIGCWCGSLLVIYYWYRTPSGAVDLLPSKHHRWQTNVTHFIVLFQPLMIMRQQNTMGWLWIIYSNCSVLRSCVWMSNSTAYTIVPANSILTPQDRHMTISRTTPMISSYSILPSGKQRWDIYCRWLMRQGRGRATFSSITRVDHRGIYYDIVSEEGWCYDKYYCFWIDRSGIISNHLRIFGFNEVI